jgi:hypothetical protein
MKTAQQKPKTRQSKAPIQYSAEVWTSDGVLILDTKTGYRDEALCADAMAQSLKMGLWVVQGEAK